MTAAATTGPAQAPRPTSSTPATSRPCSKNASSRLRPGIVRLVRGFLVFFRIAWGIGFLFVLGWFVGFGFLAGLGLILFLLVHGILGGGILGRGVLGILLGRLFRLLARVGRIGLIGISGYGLFGLG